MATNSKFRRSDGYTEEDLFRKAKAHYLSAGVLFSSSYPETFFSAGYLCHLTLEIILKACQLSSDHEFQKTHVLTRLIENISFIQLHDLDQTYIEELDKLYELRYPSNNEVGTDDYDKLRDIISIIAEKMPPELQSIFENIFYVDPIELKT